MVRLLIVSDIRLYCEGLSEILTQLGTVHVAGTANSLDSAISEIDKSAADVVLQDMTMKDSCKAIRYVLASYPDIKIVALAVPEDENDILACAQAGIAGYVAREASLDELLNAVQGAVNGELYCPPRIAASLMNQLKSLAMPSQASPEAQRPAQMIIDSLTHRERQLARLLAEGYSNKQIARCLTIEVSTVKNHVHNILVKLGVTSRGQAAYLVQQYCTSITSSPLGLEPEPEPQHISSTQI